MYLLAFYVPETHLESVKSALFAAGAGKIGNYDCCSFQTKGKGQFRPLEGSDPFLGQTGAVEEVAEYKVEMVLEEALAPHILEALKKAHPYEEPAFHFLQVILPE